MSAFSRARDIPATDAKTLRVLVVDDSQMERRLLTCFLQGWGYSTSEAASAEEALTICSTDPPDLILSDWMMPGMDGLEFCKAFRELPQENYSYFILLTAKNEKGAVARGLDTGADDFLLKPVSSHELRARISAGARILSMQRELSRKNRLISKTLKRLRQAHEEIDKDLIQARKIQESLLPELSRRFGSSRVSLLLRPCGHIGGDLVGMFSPDETIVGFYCIDVSGHGITSAMMTARLAGNLSSTYFDQNVAMIKRFESLYAMRPPADAVRILNERVTSDTEVEEYFTMLYGVADLSNGHVRIVQAGHPHPLLLRADGTVEFLGQGGVPVGLLPGLDYEDFETVMEPGDRLLFYSDGFTECHVDGGDMLGEEGLIRLVRASDEQKKTGQDFLDHLFEQLQGLLQPGQDIEDDISATLFEYKVT
ncbi:PP2C family protein-serine/threonine phosphatase [Thalassovita aquimarina]|nr:fused response regulator/phosphatase [Thalassovita aquimarina]